MSVLLERVKSSLRDSYAVEKELGEGGMAVVFLAEDLKHHRKVAIKVLRPELSESLGTERFLKEIETAAGLSHPHILPVHDSGEAGGLLYYVMPLVEGESLHDRIEREQQLPIDDALQIAREIAEALGHAHSYGIVHRDIKPENVMLYGGHAVIADFGIAKAVSAAGGERLTGTGIAVGTPQYMSPEQASGDKVDARSDVYALGCLTYEMLVGVPPFTGRNVQSLVQQHIAAPPPSASTIRPTVPPEIAAAIQQAMAKTPADRYATALDFAAALKGTRDTMGAYVRNLVRRRVPHVLGVYALLSVGAVFLIGFLVDRFVLSPHLISFAIVALASLLPTVSIVAYFRGRAWTWTVKIAIPANFVASAVLLLLAFGTKDLGAATTTVVVEDEQGNTIERVVPKSEFRKNVIIFPFDNETSDTTTDWLQHGLPIAIDLDLEQDLFIQISATGGMAEKYRQRGFPGGVGVPFALKRELASDAHQPLFITGSYAVADSGITVTVKLYETRRGKLMSERSYSGLAVLALTDEITAQLKHDLDIPTQHIEDTEDLPLVDMFTESTEAFRHLIDAYRLVTFEQDWAAATAASRRSVEIDPTNAYAQLLNYSVSMLGNDNANAAQAIEAAMQHSYKLPERTQYQVKFQYYDFNKEAEKALAVSQIRVDLFPGDIDGRLILAGLYSLRDRIPESMEQFEAILEIDPSQMQYLQQLGSLARAEGDFESATDYYQRYADENPDDYRSYTPIGSLHRLQGNFDEAKAAYERALLLEPSNVGVMVSLAGLERHYGNFAGGVTQLEAALGRAKTRQDSVAVFGALQSAHEYGGQMTEAIQYLERQLALLQTIYPPIQVLSQQLQKLDVYVKAGQEDRAHAILAAVEPQLQPPFDQLGAIGHVGIALALEDADVAEQALPRLQSLIDQLGVQALQPAVTHARARILEIRDQCAEAVPVYQEELESNPTDISIFIDIGRCQRKLRNLDAAEESLQRSLAWSPYSPTVHYQLALVSEARGDTDRAVEHLETALDIWRDADPEFKPAREAREKLEELKATT